MHRGANAIAGGAVGTTLMSLLFVLMEVQTRYAIGIFDAIARFARVPGSVYVGFLIFVVAGVLVWPLVFIAIEDYIPTRPDPAVRGMVLGLILWIPFVLAAGGDLIAPLYLVYLVVALIAHLVYGFSMGAVYASLSSDRPADYRH